MQRSELKFRHTSSNICSCNERVPLRFLLGYISNIEIKKMPSTKIPFFLIYFIVLVVLDSLSIVKTMKSYRQIRRSPMKRNMMHTRNKSFRIYQAGSSSSYSVKFRSMQRGLGAPSSPLRYNRLFSKLHNEAGNLHNKLPLDELLPDRSVYSKFFHACTASASSIGKL